MYAGLLFRFVIFNKYIIVVKRAHRAIVSGRYNDRREGRPIGERVRFKENFILIYTNIYEMVR